MIKIKVIELISTFVTLYFIPKNKYSNIYGTYKIC